jgi:4'-phosphopantetheinyl transferase
VSALPAPGTREVSADPEVWMFALDADIDESVLNATETARADRFHFDRDRVRFRRRRAILRHLLAAYTAVPAGALRFDENAFGKPQLTDPAAPQFSASSSGDLGAVAVCRHRLGVDVELVRPSCDDEDVARRLFATEEVSAIATTADFFRCWTRKEAYVKAIGAGLSFPLESFAIDVADVPRPQILRSTLRPNDRSSFTVADLSRIDAGYASAVVVQDSSANIVLHSIEHAEGVRG